MQPEEDQLDIALNELAEGTEEPKEFPNYRKKLKKHVVYRESTLCNMFRMEPKYQEGTLYAGSRMYRSINEEDKYAVHVSFAHQEFPWCCGALAIYGINIVTNRYRGYRKGYSRPEIATEPHGVQELAIFFTQIVYNMLHNNNMVLAVSMINTDSQHAGWALKKAGWKMDINRKSIKHNHAYFDEGTIQDYIYPIILGTKSSSQNKTIITPDNYEDFWTDVDEEDEY